MKNVANLFILACVLSLLLDGCAPAPTPTPTFLVSTQTTTLPTSTTKAPTSTSTPTHLPTPVGRTVVVASAEDYGSNSLRAALQGAKPWDVIVFDASVFPKDDPKVIYLQSPLPGLVQGHVTLDASMAGVVLDGSKIPPGWDSAIQIFSNNNTVRGLTITNLSGAAIQISGGQDNLVEGNVIGNSDFGIGLWGANTSGNQITANYLGVLSDGVTPQGNKSSGIWLTEKAHDNLIGPDNHIAFNGRNGIEISQSSTIRNTIFKNSIHDNIVSGIALGPGGNNSLNAPILFDFDPAMGTASGIACSSCEVLFYSDASDEGAIFEGQTVSDEDGAFSFGKGSGFVGPALTATATDPQGNTSMFSMPISGSRKSAGLQAENTFPRNLILPRRSQFLKNTRIGDTYSGVTVVNDPDPAWLSEHSAWFGYTWIRLTFGEGEWSAVQSTGRFSPLSFGNFEDQVIDHLNEQGITILYNLLYFDEDIQAGPGFLRFRTEQEIQDYLDYARMVVTHFRGRIQYYETWNEPNIMDFGQQSIAVEDYINVIRRLVPVIHAADPQAGIVIGTGSDLRDPQMQAYLMPILKSDIMPLVDGIAIHPMYGSSPDYDVLRQYYYEYPALIQKIKDTASTNGFTGEYFAEEMAWRTSAFTTEYEVWTYTETVAAKYYARGIVINRGLGLYAGIGGENYDTYPAVVRVVQNLNTVLAGTDPTESLPMEIESEAGNIRSYGFSLSNGDYLVTLWTDGVAIDDDPGIPATLTFLDFSAQEAVGYDILHGFEQQMNINNKNGTLIIPGLIVKDYPIIIRLSK